MSEVEDLHVEVYRFPTDEPEADGTLEWTATLAVVVEARSAGVTGLGWTFSGAASATVIEEKLRDAVVGRDAMDTAAAWDAMHRACRNLGTKGLVMQAISAVDIALWDLKARLLERPLTDVFGRFRDDVPIYGSGGFTTLSDDRLREQVDAWAAVGCTAMKIKIGESWGQRVERDLSRVRLLREFAGDGVALMVDANGGYQRGQACRVGAQLDDLGVVWFEEPVSSDDVAGLQIVRDALRCDVAAGEYSSDSYDTERLCAAVDCVQLDVTRCGGYTGWRRAAAVAAAHGLQVSGHCGPALHVPVAAATVNFRHLEWFIDHTRLEPELVDGLPEARDGALWPTGGSGHGMTLSPRAAAYRQ